MGYFTKRHVTDQLASSDLAATKQITEHKKRVSVQYILLPGRPFKYDTIIYHVSDTSIMQLLDKTQSNINIHKGDRYDQKLLTDERDRIDLVLKDHGYYDFSKQYIDFQVDTTIRGRSDIALQISISEPTNRPIATTDFLEHFSNKCQRHPCPID